MSIAILHTDQVAGGTVSADGGTPQTSITKCQTAGLFDKVVGPAADYDWSVDVDFGAAATYEAVAIIGSNQTDSGTVELLTDTVSSFASPDQDTDAMSFDPSGAYEDGNWQAAYGRPFVYLINNPRSDSSEAAAASWSKQYLRVHMVNTSDPPSDGYISVSQVLALSAFVPTYGARAIGKPGGRVLANAKVRRVIDVELFLTAQEEAELENLYFKWAHRERVILHPTTYNFARELTEAMPCMMTDFQAASRDAGSDPTELYRSVRCTFVEAPW